MMKLSKGRMIVASLSLLRQILEIIFTAFALIALLSSPNMVRRTFYGKTVQ